MTIKKGTPLPRWTGNGGCFVLAGLAAGLVAFLTVSFQSLKAALTNPVQSLRNE